MTPRVMVMVVTGVARTLGSENIIAAAAKGDTREQQ